MSAHAQTAWEETGRAGACRLPQPCSPLPTCFDTMETRMAPASFHAEKSVGLTASKALAGVSASTIAYVTVELGCSSSATAEAVPSGPAACDVHDEVHGPYKARA